MKCPGQDTRYWKPGDIFDVRCPRCGRDIEFFRDDVRRRCRCGRIITNPKLNLACAEWCQKAEECLGINPGKSKKNKKKGPSNPKR